MITPDELRALLKKHHWTIAVSTSGRQHVYAAKQRCGKRLRTRYIGTDNKLNILTEEEIVAKINRSEAARLVQQRDGSDQAHTEQRQPIDRAYMPAPNIIPAHETEA